MITLTDAYGNPFRIHFNQILANWDDDKGSWIGTRGNFPVWVKERQKRVDALCVQAGEPNAERIRKQS